MKSFSSKKLCLLLVSSFVLCLLVIVLYLYSIINQTIFLVLCMSCFLFSSIVINEITARFMRKKFEAKYVKKIYDIKDDIHISLSKAKHSKFSFADCYLVIKGNAAFKILVVNDNDLYFSDNLPKEKSNTKLDNCEKFYVFEIFKSADEGLKKKLQLYTFQSDKLYYTAFYFEGSNLIQAHYDKPNDIHNDNINYILDMLKVVEHES